MRRWALGAGVLATLLAIVTVAMAAAPAGPRLAIVKLGIEGLDRFALWTVNPRGGDRQRLIEGSARSQPRTAFSSLTWSADGAWGVFSGIIGFSKGDDREPFLRLFTVHADGSGLRLVPGTHGARSPVFSPDGRTVAFTRVVDRETPTTVGGKRRKEFHGASIWTVDLPTGAQRQLTPWRDGLSYGASSFSPDGSTLLATFEDSLLTAESQPVVLGLDGTVLRRVLDDGSEPVYSPDGSKIALVRRIPETKVGMEESTDLFVVDADGTGLRRLTHSLDYFEFAPSWDPSGERLGYVRFSPARLETLTLGAGDGPMQINADGTCRTPVFSSPRNGFFLAIPTWQPGPGREAGRIEC